MPRTGRPIGLSVALLLAAAGSASSAAGSPQGETETIEQSLCRLIDAAGRVHDVPAAFLTRLIWQESSFRRNVVSRAGAQGVAQFMPGTARARGLADPFDPEQAIPAAAHLVAELRGQFGNLGLAAAAYNGGPTRVSAFLAGSGGLPAETRDYVVRITGRSAEDWAADARTGSSRSAPTGDPPASGCLTVVADLKTRRNAGPTSVIAEGAIAPWGVQLAASFSKSAALAAFARNRAAVAGIVGDREPMILGSRFRARGGALFYRIRLPAPTRGEANALCARLRAAAGPCIVVRT